VPNDLPSSGTARRSTPAGSEWPRYGLLAGLALGLLPAELDQSIFATALPGAVPLQQEIAVD
jgi:hypothetical protein